jgi:DNA-binding GntR family transcriptional regulator
VDEIVDLFEMRTLLETAGFRLACERARDSEVDALAAWWATVSPGYAGLTVAGTTLVDESFHERFVTMSRNRELVRQLAGVCARIRFFRTIDMDHQSLRAPYYEDHGAIVEALRRRDAAAGQAVIARHISITRERAVEVIKEALARIFARERGSRTG